MALRSALLLAPFAALAFADTNPDAQGACDPTQGGSNACGPNGSEEWLNTGITDETTGWNPPFLDINGISHVSLDEYYQGVGASCQQYDDAFQASGAKYGIDPAILAFIAMQESSCNADASGSTPGLMQCDPSNCQNGQSSCQYPVEDNTDCGAWVLQQGLDSAGGNAIRALGAYNGWFTADDYGASQNNGKGLTTDYPCGLGTNYGSPQNLNYIHEILNGWFQGYDIYGDDSGLAGSYDCSGVCGSGNIC
ncbi:glycoside hydrolase family 23 protein [Xylariaceae sp. FL1272]|nr:glycoside hydrolase family 23 protein [Xylariaceae sp. FL1272]